jgi:hypothetical protein
MWLDKLKKSRPVNLLLLRKRYSKFANLAMSEGIGPIQSQVKTASKRRWLNWSNHSIDGSILLSCGEIKNEMTLTGQQVVSQTECR